MCDRHSGQRASRGFPGARGHPGRPPDRNQHAAAAERGGRPRHGAQVAGIGDPVKRDHQRVRAVVTGDQVVGMRVGVWPDPQCEALVDRTAGKPVKFGAPGLDHGHSVIGRQLDCLADALIGIEPRADMQRQGGDPGPQRLQHRIAAGHHLGGTACASGARPASTVRAPGAGPASTARAPAGRAGPRSPAATSRPVLRLGACPVPRRALLALGSGGGRRRGTPLSWMTRTLISRRRRALSLKTAPAVAAGARPRLARLGLAARTRSASALSLTARTHRESSQRGPAGVSSTTMPAACSWSLIVSAAA